MGGQRVDVRRLGAEDAPVAAALQARVLAHTFFAALGPRFLSAYWRALATAHDSVGFVATSDGQPVGFVVGTFDPRGQRSWIIRRHAWPLLVYGALGMLRHPAQALRFGRTRTLRYARGLRRYLRPTPPTTREGSAAAEERIGVLLHLMVAPQARGQGVGDRLASALVAAAAESDVSELQLVTLAGDSGASGFWTRMGWQPAGLSDDADRRRVERFRYRLAGSAARHAVGTRRADVPLR